MHHFIFPSQDTFITNAVGFDSLNFGIDEILRIGTQNVTSKIILPTTTYTFPPNTTVENLCVQGFSGSINTGSFYGTASYAIGNIFNNFTQSISFNTDYFSGSIIGGILNGWLNGTPYTSSSQSGSISRFSGSIAITSSNSGSINGNISGSLVTPFLSIFNGNLINFTGNILTASINGSDILNIQNVEVSNNLYNNRALVQFDISSISQSISLGNIINPQFNLKLYVAREENLPISYNIYAFPISESWVMGNGYVSDGGSVQGTSWDFRDSTNGIKWASTGSSYIQQLGVTQSFNYKPGDINMDITSIVNAWLSGSIVNNGIVLLSSDEFNSTGSGISLFYFSKDTNTIYEPVLDVAWNDSSWVTGSITTSSINIGTIPAGLLGKVVNSASISGSIYGSFTGVGNINIETDFSASGLISVTGTSALILSMSIIGDFSGSVSSSVVTVYKKCNTCAPVFNAGFGCFAGQDQTQYQGGDIYGWGNPFNPFNQYEWWGDGFSVEFATGFGGPCGSGSYSSSLVSMSLLMGTLIDGNFSGSTFTSSLINGYQLTMGYLVGSWNESLIDGTNISSSYPFKPMYPNAVTIGFNGLYVNGTAFGTISSLSSSYGLVDYGIFDGVFIDGPIVGNKIHAPFSGSILSSSFDYTSSINLISSSLLPIDITKSYTIVLQNIPTKVKAGDIIKIKVFGRNEFQIKNFNRQTQFSQFIIPEYLPSSSYYSIKDNETEQIIVDFDKYTTLSCDVNGNYFELDTTGFPQERYFKILIRTQISGNIYTFDNNVIFKIVR